MKRGLKTFLWRVFDFSVLFFLLDLAFKFTARPFPKFPEPEFFGTIMLYLVVGTIIAGIPYFIGLHKSHSREDEAMKRSIAKADNQ